MKKKAEYCFLCDCGLGTEIVHEVAVTVSGEDRGRRRVCFFCLHRVISKHCEERVVGRETFTARLAPAQGRLFDGVEGGGCDGG